MHIVKRKSAEVQQHNKLVNFFSTGVNFNKVPRAAFTLADPESPKKLLNLTVFFALLVSEGIKAARRTWMKLTPDDLTGFLHFLDLRKYKLLVSMLMKLTPVVRSGKRPSTPPSSP